MMGDAAVRFLFRDPGSPAQLQRLNRLKFYRGLGCFVGWVVCGFRFCVLDLGFVVFGPSSCGLRVLGLQVLDVSIRRTGLTSVRVRLLFPGVVRLRI